MANNQPLLLPQPYSRPTPAAREASPLCLSWLWPRNTPRATLKIQEHISSPPPHCPTAAGLWSQYFRYLAPNGSQGDRVLPSRLSQEARVLLYSHQTHMPPPEQEEGKQCQGLPSALQMVGPALGAPVPLVASANRRAGKQEGCSRVMII